MTILLILRFIEDVEMANANPGNTLYICYILQLDYDN